MNRKLFFIALQFVTLIHIISGQGSEKWYVISEKEDVYFTIFLNKTSTLDQCRWIQQVNSTSSITSTTNTFAEFLLPSGSSAYITQNGNAGFCQLEIDNVKLNDTGDFKSYITYKDAAPVETIFHLIVTRPDDITISSTAYGTRNPTTGYPTRNPATGYPTRFPKFPTKYYPSYRPTADSSQMTPTYERPSKWESSTRPSIPNNKLEKLAESGVKIEHSAIQSLIINIYDFFNSKFN